MPVLAIDQGTTNTKAVLVRADGTVVATGSAPVGVTSPRPGWVEQDAERIWQSVLSAVASLPAAPIAGVALSTQRESVVAWRAGSGEPAGPVLGWQDRRTASWCASQIGETARAAVQRRTGLRVDPMFSAPKIRWLLDHHPAGDLRVGTVDSWLTWRLTGGAAHLTEAGNASRTLLYDVTELGWSSELLAAFGIPPGVLPSPVPSAAGFGVCAGAGPIPDGTPIVAVLADSHAALYAHGTAKATYGTGSSVMAPVAGLPAAGSPVPTTLAWLLGDTPRYALEGNILSSGATLAWVADLLGRPVAELVALAETVPDSGGVTMVPAFAGLGAPHWDRDAQALISGMTTGTGRAHIARAAIDAVAHQICDVVDVIEQTTGPLATLRADGGATASALLMQTQADLLDRPVEVAVVAELSALGAARLAWEKLGHGDAWRTDAGTTYRSRLDGDTRARLRRHWAAEIDRSRGRMSA